MITAIVRYPLPDHIDGAACRIHFEAIAPGFLAVKGLISKHFIWSERNVAGGIYQWETRPDAEAFYSGPWRDGIIARYGVEPEIEFFTVLAKIDNEIGKVTIIESSSAKPVFTRE